MKQNTTADIRWPRTLGQLAKALAQHLALSLALDAVDRYVQRWCAERHRRLLLRQPPKPMERWPRVRACIRFFSGRPGPPKPPLRFAPVNADKPFEVRNGTSHVVEVWKNGNGPVAVIPAGAREVVDPEQHGGLRGGVPNAFEAKLVTPGPNYRAITVRTWTSHEKLSAVDVTSDYAERLDAMVVLRKTRLILHAKALAKRGILRRRRAAAKIVSRCRGACARLLKPCPCCLEDVPRAWIVQPASRCKSHRLCRGCAKRYLDVAIDEGRMIIRCPGVKCATLLTNKDVDVLAGARRLARLQQAVVEANTRRLRAVASDAAPGDRAFAKWAAANTKACPNCHVIIYRHAGCDNMRCRCGTNFNWRTGSVAVQERVPEPPAPVRSRSAPGRGGPALPALHEDGPVEAPAARGGGWWREPDARGEELRGWWMCPACTFENAGAMPRCEMCRAPRPRAPADRIVLG